MKDIQTVPDRALRLIKEMFPLLGFRLFEFYIPGATKPLRVHVNQLDSDVLMRPLSSDVPVLREILGGNAYLIPENILKSLSSDKSYAIIDLGANIGIATLRIANQLRKAGINNLKGICVEPDEDNFEVLSQN